MESELTMLGQLIAEPARPFLAIMGGAKVSDKIPVIENLFDKVDGLIIGGGMANTFLKAQGLEIGKSMVEPDLLPKAKDLMAEAKSRNIAFLLPQDVVVAPELAPDAPHETLSVSGIPGDKMALDIGPESVKSFTEQIKSAKTIIWNGPMGVFEMAPFAQGTVAIAGVLAGIEATTVVGGGDSVSAVKKAGVADKITHISTGGGASLEFLEGKQLPGVVALLDK